MTFPWELCEDEGCPQHGAPHVCVSGPQPDGIPAFLRRDANNRAPFMDVVATKPQPQACTEPLLMPWSADFNKPTE